MNTTLTPEAVETATLLLLHAHPNHTTTTLEVKTLLRYLGFWAEQGQVSSIMDSLLDDTLLNYHTLSGTTHRTYYLDDDEDLEDSPVEEITTFKFSNID